MNRSLFPTTLLIMSVVMVDQVTKFFAFNYLFEPRSWGPITFDLVLNTGITYGLFSTESDVAWWFVTLMVAGFTMLLAWHAFGTRQQYMLISYSLIIAGSISNIIDRLMHGAVIDFIDISILGFSWPTFNIADASIVLGVSLIIIGSMRKS